jgi:tetratricopeptide (TPR) repeat protein
VRLHKRDGFIVYCRPLRGSEVEGELQREMVRQTFIVGLALICMVAICEAQTLSPNPDERTDKAVQLVRAGDVAAARAVYEQIFSQICDASMRLKVVQASLELTVTGVADKLDAEGLALVSRGQLDNAMNVFIRTLRIREETFGSEITGVAVSLNNIGLVLLNAGRMQQAEPILRRAIAIREKIQGTETGDLAAPLNLLGAVLASQKRYVEAEQLLRRALALNERNSVVISERITILRNLEVMYGEQGKIEQARSVKLQADALARQGR